VKIVITENRTQRCGCRLIINILTFLCKQRSKPRKPPLTDVQNEHILSVGYLQRCINYWGHEIRVTDDDRKVGIGCVEKAPGETGEKQNTPAIDWDKRPP
jgi:hypothetical protein